MKDPLLLTIQDCSCVGQCSLTVALPICSACGIETAILPSSVLSNHTAKGYSAWTFKDLTDEMPNILDRWIKENISFDAFYTGYVTKTQIPHILDIMKKTAKDGALKIIDPAMADNGKLYAGFDEDFPKEMAKLCKDADYLLPNITEACLLLGVPYPDSNYDKTFIEKILSDLHTTLNAKTVIITGVSFDKNKIGAAVYDGKTYEYYFTKRLSTSYHGTGDAWSSAFTGALLRGKKPIKAAKIACDFVLESMKKTVSDPDHWYGVKFEKAIPSLVKMLK